MKKKKRAEMTAIERERHRNYDRARYLRDKEKRLALSKAYRSTDAGRNSKLKAELKRLGCTPELYFKLLRKQCGMCAICGTTLPGGDRKRLSVDHNHITGRIRGLLCQQCNNYLGHIGERLGAAQSLINYILEDKNASSYNDEERETGLSMG